VLFKITRRQRPEIFSRVDRAATQQDVVTLRDDRTDDYFWVGIVNVFALRADLPLMRVAIGNTPDKVGAG